MSDDNWQEKRDEALRRIFAVKTKADVKIEELSMELQKLRERVSFLERTLWPDGNHD